MYYKTAASGCLEVELRCDVLLVVSKEKKVLDGKARDWDFFFFPSSPEQKSSMYVLRTGTLVLLFPYILIKVPCIFSWLRPACAADMGGASAVVIRNFSLWCRICGRHSDLSHWFGHCALSLLFFSVSLFFGT